MFTDFTMSFRGWWGEKRTQFNPKQSHSLLSQKENPLPSFCLNTKSKPSAKSQYLFFPGTNKKAFSLVSSDAGPTAGHQLWAVFLQSLYQPVIPPDSQTMPNSILASDFPVGSSLFLSSSL